MEGTLDCDIRTILYLILCNANENDGIPEYINIPGKHPDWYYEIEVGEKMYRVEYHGRESGKNILGPYQKTEYKVSLANSSESETPRRKRKRN